MFIIIFYNFFVNYGIEQWFPTCEPCAFGAPRAYLRGTTAHPRMKIIIKLCIKNLQFIVVKKTKNCFTYKIT